MRHESQILNIFHLVVLICFLSAIERPAELNASPSQTHGFDLDQVHLLDGPFKHAQDLDRENLLTMDMEELYYPFRREARLTTNTAERITWHYSTERGNRDSLFYNYTGHTLGHYLSAAAMMWRNTGDVAVKQRADAAVAVLADCQKKFGDGYIGGMPEKSFLLLEGLAKDDPANPMKAAVPWYCVHKLYAGLLDMYVLTGNQQALEVLQKAMNWVDNNLSQLNNQQMKKMLRVEHGGMNELLINFYALTGNEKYLQLAKRFTDHAVIDPFLEGKDPLDGLHANTQIPKFVGAARESEVTGDPTMAKAALAFWDDVVYQRSYVDGGDSLKEHFSPKAHLSNLGTNTCESCNEYNMLKLTRSLFCEDPQAKFADYYERTLFNHVLASRNPEDGGQIYFLEMESGSMKGRWMLPKGPHSACCYGTGMESAAKFADSIYFCDDRETLFINLYISSVLDWKAKGLSLRQETHYPETGRSEFIFNCQQPLELNLNLRRPWWATADFQILVNGQRQKTASTPGSFVSLHRTWQTGDKLDVIMPMTLYLEGFVDNPNRVAILYGPLVLAGITQKNNPYSVIKSDRARILDALKPVRGHPLMFNASAEVFRTSNEATTENPVLFKPLMNVVEEAYSVYWDISIPSVDVGASRINTN